MLVLCAQHSFLGVALYKDDSDTASAISTLAGLLSTVHYIAPRPRHVFIRLLVAEKTYYVGVVVRNVDVKGLT